MPFDRLAQAVGSRIPRGGGLGVPLGGMGGGGGGGGAGEAGEAVEGVDGGEVDVGSGGGEGIPKLSEKPEGGGGGGSWWGTLFGDEDDDE